MVGRYQSSNRSRQDDTYSFLDTAGDAVRQYLRGQLRTDLPFKLSHYRPDGEGTDPLLTRILTEYDVPVQSLKALAHGFHSFPNWVQRTVSPVFWTHVVVSLDSIWVTPEPAAPTAPGEVDRRGSLERFLCKAEEKLNDDSRSEVVDGIESIEFVDCKGLNSYRVDSQHYQAQMLRFARVLESLRPISVFRWSSELPIGLSILRVLAHKPRLTTCHLRIDAQAMQRHNFPKDTRATIPLNNGGEILTPFCTAFQGVPDVPTNGGFLRICAEVKIVLEEAAEEDCVVIPEWIDLAFDYVTTLTVRSRESSQMNAPPVQLEDGNINRPNPDGSNRSLEVQELILVRVVGNAARHLTSRVRLGGFRSLVLEFCTDYAAALMPLAHQPSSLGRLEVYSPSAAWHKDTKSEKYQRADDILLCDFIRSATSELHTLHMAGGMFGADRFLHNHLFFAIQAHLPSLRQLRVIASDAFDLAELREIGLCAPKLADLLIRATADDFLPTLPTALENFPALRTLTLHHAATTTDAAAAQRRRRQFLAATHAAAAANTPLTDMVYCEGTPDAGFRSSFRIARPRRKRPFSRLVGTKLWRIPELGFRRGDVV